MTFRRNHPIYRDIIFHEFRQQVIQPNELRIIAENSISTSRVGNIGHYQSGNVLLEEINKSGKKWTMGVSTNSQWQKSFRNLNNLTKVNLVDFVSKDSFTFVLIDFLN